MKEERQEIKIRDLRAKPESKALPEKDNQAGTYDQRCNRANLCQNGTLTVYFNGVFFKITVGYG